MPILNGVGYSSDDDDDLNEYYDKLYGTEKTKPDAPSAQASPTRVEPAFFQAKLAEFYATFYAKQAAAAEQAAIDATIQIAANTNYQRSMKK